MIIGIKNCFHLYCLFCFFYFCSPFHLFYLHGATNPTSITQRDLSSLLKDIKSYFYFPFLSVYLHGTAHPTLKGIYQVYSNMSNTPLWAIVLSFNGVLHTILPRLLYWTRILKIEPIKLLSKSVFLKHQFFKILKLNFCITHPKERH